MVGWIQVNVPLSANSTLVIHKLTGAARYKQASSQQLFWQSEEEKTAQCLPPSFLLDDIAEKHFSPARKREAIIMLLFEPKASPPHLHQSVRKSVLYTGGFPVLSFRRIKLMKHSLYSNMKGTPRVKTGKILYVSRFLKRGETGREGESLMTDVPFLPSGPMCSSWMVLPSGLVIPLWECESLWQLVTNEALL